MKGACASIFMAARVLFFFLFFLFSTVHAAFSEKGTPPGVGRVWINNKFNNTRVSYRATIGEEVASIKVEGA